MHTIGKILGALLLSAVNNEALLAQQPALRTSEVVEIGEKIRDFRLMVGMQPTHWNWCKIRPLRATMPDSVTTCAPWRTADLPPDTGTMTYVEPFVLRGDSVLISVATKSRDRDVYARIELRRNAFRYWVVERYCIIGYQVRERAFPSEP
jgi:hypothetical protein